MSGSAEKKRPKRVQFSWHLHLEKLASGRIKPTYLEDPCRPALVEAWAKLVGEAFAGFTKPLRQLGDTLTVGFQYPLTRKALAPVLDASFVERLRVELGKGYPRVRHIKLVHCGERVPQLTPPHGLERFPRRRRQRPGCAA